MGLLPLCELTEENHRWRWSFHAGFCRLCYCLSSELRLKLRLHRSRPSSRWGYRDPALSLGAAEADGGECSAEHSADSRDAGKHEFKGFWTLAIGENDPEELLRRECARDAEVDELLKVSGVYSDDAAAGADLLSMRLEAVLEVYGSQVYR